jgi:sodium/proline symporter
MHTTQLFVFLGYFLALMSIVYFSYHRQKGDRDFVIGNRSLNFWLTALSAHASDMSNWLFMGYPALIFITGIFNIWTAIGLVVFMYLNWTFIAPKIRVATEKTNSLTLNAYFENRFQDKSGAIRKLSAIMSIVFFVFYISAGLVGLGFLAESLFGLPYTAGISLGLCLVVFYVFLGGYTTVAWIDLFQGFFLLAVILAIPFYLLPKIGGISAMSSALASHQLSISLFPSFSMKTFADIFFIACGWGLGYLGQPHILTKFMGIKEVSNMYKAKYVGISWQTLALLGATLFGLMGIVLFPQGLSNPEFVILESVKIVLPPIFSALILCAILAATTNVMAAQILVVASVVSEDFYKRFYHPSASKEQILTISRYSVVGVGLFAYVIAFFQISSIYNLVFYSWSGLGASFGPLVLLSLYKEKITKKAAFLGILTGGVVSGVWPLVNQAFSWNIPSMIPGFFLSLFVIFLFSFFGKKTTQINNKDKPRKKRISAIKQ